MGDSGVRVDTFSDLAGLQLPPEQQERWLAYWATRTSPPPKLRGPRLLPARARSIGGPIPVSWLVAAATHGRDALLVGLMVWCAKNWPKLRASTTSVVLSYAALEAWGVASSGRALSRLEAAGLIQIVCCGGPHIEVNVLVPKTGGYFLLGPVDVAWICRAGRFGVTALLCGLALWYVRGRRRRWKTYDHRVVSNIALEGWGISRHAKHRALLKMEAAGLVDIERRSGCSPRVTILSPYAKERA